MSHNAPRSGVFLVYSIMASVRDNVNTVNQSSIIRSPRAIRRRNTGGNFCCVVDCSNNSEKDRIKGEGRSYYRFPAEDSKQFSLWTTQIRRANWTYKSWNRICSDHFKGGKLKVQ